MSTHNQPQDDLAMAARLRRLADMPVDTSRLENAIESQVYGDEESRVFRVSYWLQPMRAVAASVMFVVLLAALLISTSGGPVLASPVEMAKFHQDLVDGNVPVVEVTSMQAAEKAIAKQWRGSPQLPGIPNDHAMACCMRSVKNKKVACVLLRDTGEPVTMTVANASDMQLPKSDVKTQGGFQYHVQSVNDLNMVMTERDGRWVCLVSKLPSDRLVELSSALEF